MKRLRGLLQRRRLEVGLFLVLVLLLLLDGVLAQGYRSGLKEIARLEKEVSEEKRVVAMFGEYESLVAPAKGELIEANAKLVQTQSLFPKELDELGVISLLIEAAVKSNVDVANFQVGSGGQENLAVNSYKVVKYGVVAQGGQLSHLAVFFSYLEGASTQRVENLVLTSTPDRRWKATFQLVQLGRQD